MDLISKLIKPGSEKEGERNQVLLLLLLLFSINIIFKNYMNLLKLIICCLLQSNKTDHLYGIKEFHEFH